MLKAYSYIETEILDSGIADAEISRRERQIIAGFVDEHPTPKTERPCVICGGKTSEFAVIYGVYYQICAECYSISAPVDEKTLEKYKTYPPLVEFRDSEEYQSSAAQRREGIWDDFLFWLEYRFARYLRRNTGISIENVHNRYYGLAEKIKKSGFCTNYNTGETADAVLYLDQFRCEANPLGTLLLLRDKLRDGGLLVLSTRVGSGFDVLTLKGCQESIFPYESILLPSIEGLGIILEKTGFEVLELSTPGAMDVEHVLKNKEGVNPDDWFVNYLIRKSDEATLAEFQRLLQKSGMSSHARVIARKRCVQ